jgi:hypothetical protein
MGISAGKQQGSCEAWIPEHHIKHHRPSGVSLDE